MYIKKQQERFPEYVWPERADEVLRIVVSPCNKLSTAKPAAGVKRKAVSSLDEYRDEEDFVPARDNFKLKAFDSDEEKDETVADTRTYFSVDMLSRHGCHVHDY